MMIKTTRALLIAKFWLCVLSSVLLLTAATHAFAQQNVKQIDGLMKQYYDYGQFNGSILSPKREK